MNASPFDPLVRDWFANELGEPTEIQRLAWPRIAAGEHVLVISPTGSGKTLAAFLWAIEQLLAGRWSAGGLRVLYVSPLKALASDVERNLSRPLAALARSFTDAGREPSAIRVAVRTGDTPPAERQRLLRRPPEILITTPESLNLLLLGRDAVRLFTGLEVVILDEIHAVAPTKRGTHLVTAVERLVPIAGEFQRVALSATVDPAETVAAWLGGFRRDRAAGGTSRYEARAVSIVRSGAEKRYELSVRGIAIPEPGDESEEGSWRVLAADLRAKIRAHRSTIVFSNSRRTVEKVARFLNEGEGTEIAWAHHGSLSKEVRRAVEERLKAGKLPAIVATSSLELGIDIGAVDLVVLVQAPRSASSAAQRIGRAGHRVGETSRAIFYPTHPRDILECAVVARAVLERAIESVAPIRAPLDLLAQLVLAMTAREAWSLDELFDAIRGSSPYRDLSRRHFDLVIEMLGGRYADRRIAELKPRLAVDRFAGTAVALPGAVRLLAQAGGTIPDRGYFQLRLDDSRALLGELDEEFVWERSVGDGFMLGAQAWRIRAIHANEVLVSPARGGAMLAPFWRADAADRGYFLSDRIGRFLEEANRRLDDPALAAELRESHCLEPGAAESLVLYLREQRLATGIDLPHRRHLVCEEAAERSSDASRRAVALYTFRGGRVNRPLAIALGAAWEESGGAPLEIQSNDDAILFVGPRDFDPLTLLASIDPLDVESLLRRKLEASGFFGGRFRQNAGRALLLPRGGARRRTPLWLSRENAKRLLEAVADAPDFPIVLETWRTCLLDEFELPRLRELLDEVRGGAIRCSWARTTRPSPFSANLLWRRTNELMYEDDAPKSRRPTALAEDLVREVALAADDRPEIAPELVETQRRKVQRTAPGYAPQSALELVEWVKERWLVPESEWEELVEAAAQDGGAPRDELLEGAAARLALISLGRERSVVALENAARLLGLVGRSLDEATFEPIEPGQVEPFREGLASARQELKWSRDTGAMDLAELLEEWLRFESPMTESKIAALWGLEPGLLRPALDRLARRGSLVRGRLVEGAGDESVAHRRTFETLLRLRRSSARASIRARPLEELPLFLAVQQRLVDRGTGIEGTQAALERLFGFPATAALWEEEILPARLDPYFPAWLDSLAEESGLVWLGAERGRTTFILEEEIDLLRGEPEPGSGEDGEILELLSERRSGWELEELVERLDRGGSKILESLWALAFLGDATASLRALRAGIANDFASEVDLRPATAQPAGRRAAFRRWQATRPPGARWRALPRRSPTADPLGDEERARARARLLLDRYGIVFRELVAPELPALAWAGVARALRALELSGEAVGGQFFRDVPGLQFASPAAVANFEAGLPEGAVFWMNAADPASLCGIELAALRGRMPRRVASTTLVYHGSRLVLEARRSGREIAIAVAPDDPSLPRYLEPFRVRLSRATRPQRRIDVETINGEPAARSPYRAAFADFAITEEPSGLRLLRRYGARAVAVAE